MYESFFGFSQKPFTLLPDANFFYQSKRHNLALTMLRYGLESQALITVITGEIGCGKTTLVRKLLDEVSEKVTVGLITNTHSALGDPLKWVLLSFGLPHVGQSKVEQYQTLTEFLIDEYAQNRHSVLIVDEAQNLDYSGLEELRMLSNINVDNHQLLQLMLIGQPELRQTLRRPELRQFAQRISAEYHIIPLSPEETASYIQHRLEKAGGDSRIFLPETFTLVHEHSKGVPRLINLLCETSLIYAYGSGKTKIDSDLIKEVIRDRESGIYFQDKGSVSAPRTGVHATTLEEEMRDIPPGTDTNHFSRDNSTRLLEDRHTEVIDPELDSSSRAMSLTKLDIQITELESEIEKTNIALKVSEAVSTANASGPKKSGVVVDLSQGFREREPETPVKATPKTSSVAESDEVNTYQKALDVEFHPGPVPSNRSTIWKATVLISLLTILLSIITLYVYQNPSVMAEVVGSIQKSTSISK